jgi:hypothetical protein
MEISASLFLIAVGAILKYAVTVHVTGINLQNAGVILIALGVLGLILSVLMTLRSWWDRMPPLSP